MMIKRIRAIASPIRRGEKTHHQEILITPKSLRKKRIRKITPPRLTPLLDELLLLIIFYNV